MRIRVNFTYVTSLLDGVDVMTRRYPARQHARRRGVATHTGDASVGQETQLPVSCSSRHGSKPIPPVPALYHWHAARQRFTQYPTRATLRPPKTTQYIYKNNLSPIQFVLPSTQYTKCIPINVQCFSHWHYHIRTIMQPYRSYHTAVNYRL